MEREAREKAAEVERNNSHLSWIEKELFGAKSDLSLVESSLIAARGPRGKVTFDQGAKTSPHDHHSTAPRGQVRGDTLPGSARVSLPLPKGH